MALRKASAYTKHYTRPYTRRSSVRSKSYIKTIPPQKIVRFNMGNLKEHNEGKFNFILKLISEETIQIRDNAIESMRQFIHKNLEESMLGNYFFGIKTYPHHIQRENKALTGAGADRMQTGMQLSFGTAIGRAALVKEGKEILEIAVMNDKNVATARKILSTARTKLPCRTRIVLERR